MLRKVLFAVALTLGGPSVAAPGGEHWTATSTTASAITGNITLEANRIVFSSGGSLPIARIKNGTVDDGMGKKVPASLYRVTTPADPSLKGGNQLCGNGPVTYIAIWHVKPIMPTDAEGRAFAAYTGAAEPPPNAGAGCGTFLYELGK
jgi:hypothetical protein